MATLAGTKQATHTTAVRVLVLTDAIFFFLTYLCNELKMKLPRKIFWILLIFVGGKTATANSYHLWSFFLSNINMTHLTYWITGYFWTYELPLCNHVCENLILAFNSVLATISANLLCLTERHNSCSRCQEPNKKKKTRILDIHLPIIFDGVKNGLYRHLMYMLTKSGLKNRISRVEMLLEKSCGNNLQIRMGVKNHIKNVTSRNF